MLGSCYNSTVSESLGGALTDGRLEERTVEDWFGINQVTETGIGNIAIISSGHQALKIRGMLRRWGGEWA